LQTSEIIEIQAQIIGLLNRLVSKMSLVIGQNELWADGFEMA
jgi:hypothetical protein